MDKYKSSTQNAPLDIGLKVGPYPALTELTSSYVSPTGAKRDSSKKTPYGLVPLDLLDGTARVFRLGEVKYGRSNYRKGFPPFETLGSVIRHLTSIQQAIDVEDFDGSKGYLLDAESGEAHVHHLSCSILIMIDSLRRAGYNV